MTPTDDEEPPLVDPAESLRLIKRERANLERELTPDPRLMYWPWGFAWLIGLGAFFLRYGPGGRVLVDMPDWLPLALLMASIFTAGVITGIAGSRSSRQMTGPSSRQAAMYGWTWFISFFGLSIVFGQLSGTLPDSQLNLLWGGGMVALTGALHMAGGVIWNDRNLFVLGVWTSLINIGGVIAGPGWHSLIVAIGGGGGMIVLGLIGWLRLR